MLCNRLLLAAALTVGLASPAWAGVFSRKPKPNPATRVPELLVQVKSAADESQRSTAAEELRQYDPKEHPEIIPVLIETLGKDASPGVRSEAATSLGKLRPITQQAGYALEQAQNGDASMRVRLAARQALFQYHLVGYRSGKPEMPGEKEGTKQVSVPPTSDGPAGMVVAPPKVHTVKTPTGLVRETTEPPLADPTMARSQPAAIPASRTKTAAPAQLIPTQFPRVRPITERTVPAPATKPPSEDPATKSTSDGPLLPPV